MFGAQRLPLLEDEVKASLGRRRRCEFAGAGGTQYCRVLAGQAGVRSKVALNAKHPVGQIMGSATPEKQS